MSLEITNFYFEKLDIKTGDGRIVKKNNPVYYGEKIRLIVFCKNANVEKELSFQLCVWKENRPIEKLQRTVVSLSNAVNERDLKLRQVSKTPHIIYSDIALRPMGNNLYYGFSDWITIPVDWYQLIESYEISAKNNSTDQSDKYYTYNPFTLCLTAVLNLDSFGLKNQKLFQKFDESRIEKENDLCILLDIYKKNDEELIFDKKMNVGTQNFVWSFTRVLYELPYNDKDIHQKLCEHITNFAQFILQQNQSPESNLWIYKSICIWLKRYPLFAEQYDKYSTFIFKIDLDQLELSRKYSNLEFLKKQTQHYDAKIYLARLDVTGGGGYDEHIEKNKKAMLRAGKHKQSELAASFEKEIDRFSKLKENKLQEIYMLEQEKQKAVQMYNKANNELLKYVNEISYYILLLKENLHIII